MTILKSAEPIELKKLVERFERDGRETAKTGELPRSYSANADGSVTMTSFSAAPDANDASGVPTVPEEPKLAELAKKYGVVWKSEYAARVKKYVASTEEPMVDMGDVILMDFDFSTFDRNPVMPYDHNWSTVIGAHLQWGVVAIATKLYKGNALYTHAMFAPPEVSEFADQQFRLVEAGLLRGISLGWNPMEILDVKDPEERAKLKLGKYGIVYKRSRLLEMSPTPLPRISSALLQAAAVAKNDGKLKAEDLRSLIDHSASFGKRHLRVDAQNEMHDSYRSLAAMLFPDQRWSKTIVSAGGTPDSKPVTSAATLDTIAAKLGEIEAKLDANTSLITATLPGMASAIQDVRALVEEKAAAKDQDADEQSIPVDPNANGVASINKNKFLAAFAAGPTATK